MSAAWSGLASNSTAGNRLLNIGQCALHLSTGDLVMLVWDPSLTLPNQITLQVVTSHTSPSVIGYVSQDLFQAGTSGHPQSLTMCRDASDNIYVIGAYGQDPYGYEINAQCFLKQSGLAWTVQGACFNNVNATAYPQGFAAVWCDTGGGPGGSGHILVIANSSDGSSRYEILQCYHLLSGLPTGDVASSGTNPTFLSSGGGAYTPSCGSNIDMDANGFGATSGLSLNTWTGGSSSNGKLLVGGWGVSASGVLTGPGGLVGILNTGVLNATTKVQLVNYGNNRWAAIYPSALNAGQLTITGLTGSGLAGSTVSDSSVDTGTPTNFPTSFSSTLSWGAMAGPPNASEIWIYGWSTATNTTMLRLPVVFTAAGIPSIDPANIVTDDTSVGSPTNSTIRVVDDVVDFQHADWQAFDTVSTTLSLLGDYSVLPAAPLPVTLVSPVNNALVAVAGTYVWTYNPAFPGDAQVTFYFRRALQPGGTYQWWTGSTWSGTETAITSATTSYSFGGGDWTAGDVYSWSIDVTGTSGIRAGYASPQFVGIANASPSQPTLTASYDSTNDRSVLTIAGTGTDTAWFEYSDDGSTWFNVRGATAVVQVSGAATVYDWEIPPGATRSYRVSQTSTAGIGSLPSAWSSTHTVTSTLTTFVLRDPQALTVGIFAHVQAATLSTSFGENLTEHTLLGRSDTLVIGDVIGLEDGACTFMTYSSVDETALLALIQSQSPLLFKSPDGRFWYTRWNVARPVNTPFLVRPGSYREHNLSWRGQQRPPS